MKEDAITCSLHGLLGASGGFWELGCVGLRKSFEIWSFDVAQMGRVTDATVRYGRRPEGHR